MSKHAQASDQKTSNPQPSNPQPSTLRELTTVDAPIESIDLSQPNLYINRELSVLEFNQRVLEQAKDPDVPLLERLRFLCISTTNMDEFFEVRVAGFIQKAELGSTTTGPDKMLPNEVLNAISERAHRLVDEQYQVLNETLLPLLEKEGIRFIRRQEWNDSQEAWLRKYFQEELLPVLTPVGLDPAHPFPRILNKSLNFIVELSGKDAFGRNRNHAIVQAPRALPRLIQLPVSQTDGGGYDFVFLSSVIHEYVNELFHGMDVKGCYQFRVTRNSNMFVDEEEIDDLLRAVEGELASRRYGDGVRLEVAHNCPENLVGFLLDRFDITEREMYLVNGPVNLNRLAAVIDLVERPDLKYMPFTPGLPKSLSRRKDIFSVLSSENVLLHHPFQSFAPVIDLLRQAAKDPYVISVRQTLYRTGPNSIIVDALVAAAKAGKEVTVVVELRARFDEEANISLANRLQEAGVHVVYGVVGYKTHAKMLLVVRREEGSLRYYVHLGTGNYHPSTTRVYTDYGLMTADQVIGRDIHNVFLQLTSLGKVGKLEKILQSPFSLHPAVMGMIDKEIENHQKGKPARIIIKINSLTEPQSIQALYRASMAGVKVDLIIRGICNLRPGMPGISENITVRSLVGRFLEHTRIYYFENAGDPKIYCASADLMERNLFQRVETGFPIENKKIRKRIIGDIETYLKDNTNSWLLNKEGNYVRVEAGEEPSFSAQKTLLEALAEQA